MNRIDSADIRIGSASKEELADILALLDECELPKEGLAAYLPTILVARVMDSVVGCAALELYQEYALLRSVAVKPLFRGRGLGMRLTRAALDLAKHHQVSVVYLLTETAIKFFVKLDFKPIQRSNVPQKVQSSIQFTTLCPDTATVMMISLVDGSKG
ncbi:MAG TPA: arsenic resistance N-acetyltransferase ArsN2 [Candidatus Bathyarchaeia archaeon]|nr:arsenic resistance N-acetyltransferase ArsN2 [Candidatus Bathyarchaeia archaeon]